MMMQGRRMRSQWQPGCCCSFGVDLNGRSAWGTVLRKHARLELGRCGCRRLGGRDELSRLSEACRDASCVSRRRVTGCRRSNGRGKMGSDGAWLVNRPCGRASDANQQLWNILLLSTSPYVTRWVTTNRPRDEHLDLSSGTGEKQHPNSNHLFNLEKRETTANQFTMASGGHAAEKLKGAMHQGSVRDRSPACYRIHADSVHRKHQRVRAKTPTLSWTLS
jgi:hypothetical protein